MTKYDDYEFHAGEAVACGQPEDNGFTHIGFVLSWLIRRGFGKAEFFGPEIGRQLEDRSLRPNDLRDFTDGKLISDMLEPEGSAFLDSYYIPRYAADYEAEFGDSSHYGIEDNPDNEARIDSRVDAAYAQWIASGRPTPNTDGLPGMVLEIQKLLESGSPIPPESMAKLGELGIKPPPIEGIVFEYCGPAELLDTSVLPAGIDVRRVEPKRWHLDPDLESLIVHAVGVPLCLDTLPTGRWGSALLNRALRDLGVKPADALLATGMDEKAETIVEVYRLPGFTAPQLAPHLGRYLERRVGGKWRDGWLRDGAARLSGATIAGRRYIYLWFALDGYAAYLASTAPEPDVVNTAGRLCEALQR